MNLRVATVFLFHACHRQCPGGTTGSASLASPLTAAFPVLRTLYTRGFNRFVTSTIALIATGWSESYQAGLAPAEKQRLCTAHVKDGLGSGYS